MSARRCFSGKVAAGAVARRAGERLLAQLDDFEQAARAKFGDGIDAMRQAARETADQMLSNATRAADDARDAAIHQADFLDKRITYQQKLETLRNTPGDLGGGSKAPAGIPLLLGSLKKQTDSELLDVARSLLMRDPREIADWGNAYYLARTIRERAHSGFAQAIEFLRAKSFGFKQEALRELDTLRAQFGRTDVQPDARLAIAAWRKVEGEIADQFVEAGGRMVKRENYFPNPAYDDSKVRAIGLDRTKALIRDAVDRARVLDFDTVTRDAAGKPNWASAKPMADAKFERLLDAAVRSMIEGGVEGPPSAAFAGKPVLAASREAARLFQYTNADAWMRVAEAIGTHASPYQAMIDHIAGMADDIAMLRTFGRNPESFKRFVLDQFKREPGRLAVAAGDLEKGGAAAATKLNRRIESRARGDAKQFEDLWAEITGANAVPVNMEMAKTLGDTRALLGAAQLGQAIVAAFSDTATLAMTARLNGLPVTSLLKRAVTDLARKGSEIEAAQAGVIADSIAHSSHHADRILGESIRSGTAGKLVQGVIRASGLRAWTARLRGAFAQEMMAKLARDRHVDFAALEPQFRDSLARYGIAADDWAKLKNAEDYEPRPGAPFLRAQDVAAIDRGLSEKLSRLINTEMDFAVIETDPLARARIIGDSRPGTGGGEVRRAVGMYRSFTVSLMTLHFARAAARGWDGSRLGHAALTFLAMTAFGALSMQAKEINAGRDPLSLDPRAPHGLQAWGRATLQGGGLGVFGDMLFVDKTRYGNSWAAMLAGPQASAIESVVGQGLIKNIIQAAQGKETHFLGDLAYAGGHLLPGSNLAPLKLAFQRAVLDQAALMLDDRARERFARLEQDARQNWGQATWWQPGRLEPRRGPGFGP